MPEDPIFGDAGPALGGGPAPVASAEPSPSASGAASPSTSPGASAAIDPAQFAALQSQVSQLATQFPQFAQQVSQAIMQLSQRQEPAQPEPKASQDASDLVSKFTEDPAGLIREIATGAYKDLTKDQSDLLQTLLATQSRNLLDDAAFDIDQEFGPDTWREVIKPRLDPHIRDLTGNNPKVLADQASVTRLVNMVKGELVSDLTTRKAAHDAKVAQDSEASMRSITDRISATLPASGLRRQTRDPNAKDIPGFDLYSREVAAATGEQIDPKEFAKFHAIGGPAGTTLSDFLKATTKPKPDATTQQAAR